MTAPVRVDDVVVMADDNSPRNCWPKGVVTQVYPGKRGVIRVVDVRTATGTYRRPVHKLIILDVNQSSSKAGENVDDRHSNQNNDDAKQTIDANL